MTGGFSDIKDQRRAQQKTLGFLRREGTPEGRGPSLKPPVTSRRRIEDAQAHYRSSTLPRLQLLLH